MLIENTNFRDFRKVQMVTVLEGNGTSESPYREERYLFDDNGSYLGIVKHKELYDTLLPGDVSK